MTLLIDVRHLDNLVSIARHLFVNSEDVQNLAASNWFEKDLCAIINICVKITARGYDGDGDENTENIYNRVIRGFKKLLVGCLQCLSNLVTQNERLKLTIWVELFDSDSSIGSYGEGSFSERLTFGPPSKPRGDAAGDDDTDTLHPIAADMDRSPAPVAKPQLPPPAWLIYLAENLDKIKTELLEETEDQGVPEHLRSKRAAVVAARRWVELSAEEKQKWVSMHDEQKDQFETELEQWKTAGRPEDASTRAADVENKNTLLRLQREALTGVTNPAALGDFIPNTLDADNYNLPGETVSDQDDQNALVDYFSPPTFDTATWTMHESATDGAKKLNEGKLTLLKRLNVVVEDDKLDNDTELPLSPVESPPAMESEDDQLGPLDGDENAELDGASSTTSSEEDEYPLAGDDGRGLLTDVPLVLGPEEIDVLPILVMSGISPPLASQQAPSDNKSVSTENFHAIRCHFFLAQENGRNLLRELLIFIAAWDIREDELYFKLMVRIMEAILRNGLMPFAYGSFKETKDIISPAQAVMLKLLAKIFHSNESFIGKPNTMEPPPAFRKEARDKIPLRFDIQVVHCLFSEFRRSIVPQICALIFLQGQIHSGIAQVEDFPLNLWDMERMYEGIYQYLEFFALLTDHDEWKQLMADWEACSELIILIKELEVAIPKTNLVTTSASKNHPQPDPLNSTQASKGNGEKAAHMPSERPYDSGNTNDTYNAAIEAELAESIEPLRDEPAHFEWRNLKKLCILVLSSLVWKNKRLQDQVRKFDGIRWILSCCTLDDNNPYIREHAIMCVRFVLEGNAENTRAVREMAEMGMEGSSPVPKEVLDQHGYETIIDAKGKVGLRRKPTPSQSHKP